MSQSNRSWEYPPQMNYYKAVEVLAAMNRLSQFADRIEAGESLSESVGLEWPELVADIRLVADPATRQALGAALLDDPLDKELQAALRKVLDEFDYWTSEPRPAIDGGTVRLHKFTEVQPEMERAIDEARAALDSTGGTE